MRARQRILTVAHSVLVVDVDAQTLAETSGVLADAGYLVIQSSSFADARQRLALTKPDVLMTAVRLGGFNGLHLVISCRATLPGTVAILTHAVHDAALQADASEHQAVYLVKPIDWSLCLDVLSSLLAARGERPKTSRPRRWTRKQPTDQVDATLGSAAATVIDLSYGGVRLQFSARVTEASSRQLPLALPAAGFAVLTRPVWTQGAGPEGPWWCGVEVQEPDPVADRAWRAFVDSVGQDAAISS
jgi:DNA-binding response OmpR family regulator